MAAKKSVRAGDHPPARSHDEAPAKPADIKARASFSSKDNSQENISREDTPVMPAYGLRTPVPQAQQQTEGVTVIGEAVRRVAPETAEFLIEVSSTGPTAAQAIRDNQAKSLQISQAIAPAGVQPSDVEVISMKVQNFYAPLMPSLPAYGGQQQIGYVGFPSYAAGQAQPEMQFGSYVATRTLRVNVRDPGRVGDAADAAARTGATILGGFRLRPTDEAAARRTALEAAGKDARMKAEVLATASGRQIGDPIAISEDIVASNGMYGALRAALPFAFGAGSPETIGDLEYYARVSVNFRLA
jgi:uncharacterized protein YggE